MITAAAIRLLTAKGLSVEEIAEVAEALEHEGEKASAGALRQRRYRERKASQSVTSDVTVTPEPSVTRYVTKRHKASLGDASRVRDNSSLSVSTGKKKERSEAKASSLFNRRARFCPDHWNPSESTLALALQLGFSDDQVALELTKMRDHEFRDPHSDWDKTFRRWLRTAAERMDIQPPSVKAAYDADFVEKQKARIREYAAQQQQRETSRDRPPEPPRRNGAGDLRSLRGELSVWSNPRPPDPSPENRNREGAA